jgi:GAF domain-containing protein
METMSAADSTRMTTLAYAERARTIAKTSSPADTIAAIVALALECVDCDYASVTVVNADGSVETVASSDQLVDRADALQYELGEGPCLTAAEHGGLWAVAETGTDPRWPRWGPQAAALGLHSILSIHLFTDRTMLGALNLYAAQSHQYSDDDIENAQVVAAHASVGLARSRSEQNLWRAVDARHVVGQAQGILMERFSLGSEQAFSVLKRYSQEHNIKIRDVAVHLLSTGEMPPGALPAGNSAERATAGTGESA